MLTSRKGARTEVGHGALQLTIFDQWNSVQTTMSTNQIRTRMESGEFGVIQLSLRAKELSTISCQKKTVNEEDLSYHE